ncbi:TPA: hypothetical protein UMV35_002316 [Stenotrophomonas maltophilia]|uniref:hypothetical protein n=1 Tax=Stenotrophomonas maltophilia TaxID=40324 RepID=UPI0006AC91E7|nr:hypothetical protein [Stenotrophomonas maltophilia]HEL3750019.1 hypothetical protein [Stenotrophomonas maltophilia]HEL7728538.1 hypothetical protein [Stenotrophomonas maltophilia]
MHRIDTATAAAGGAFTEGNPTIGVPATVVSADWLNAVQEEICRVVEGAGLTLHKSERDQLWQAIQRLVAPPGSTTEAGTVRLATVEETVAGAADDIAVTPEGLAGLTATESRRGLAQFASAEQTAAGDGDLAVTPSALLALTATESRRGLVELATVDEAATPVGGLALTPAGLAAVLGAFVEFYGGSGVRVGPFHIRCGSTNVPSDSSLAISFAPPFPTGCFVGLATFAFEFTVTGGDDSACGAYNWTKDGMTLRNGLASSGPLGWIAIGH